MRILPLKQQERGSDVSFNRRLTVKEMSVYTKTVQDSLKALDKEVGLIIHNSSVPSRTFLNTGIGSLLSKTSEIFFLPFLKMHGITTIQQEPNYLRRKSDPSPYDCISTAKNIYMIPIERLATEEYGNLITKDELREVVQQRSNPGTNKVDYKQVRKSYNKVLWKAYERFCGHSVLSTGNSNQERNMFLQIIPKMNELENDEKKSTEIKANALYEILTNKVYRDENWKKWSEVDKKLFVSDSTESKERIKFLEKKYAREIGFIKFKQVLTELEIEKANRRNKELGIKVIADTPVAFTPAEVWLHQDLFMDDFSLGCPPDYFSKDGQRWEFAVLKPEKIFNPDGSLGKAGEFMKQRYEEIFRSSPGGIRIDHFIGLVDPFVYKSSEPKMNYENSGRLYSSPDKPIFAKYAKSSEKEYAAIIEKILLPAAEKCGLTKRDIICEDLGELTQPVKDVMSKHELSGLSITQFGASGYDAPEKNVIMMGSHDNKSYIEYTEDFFKNSSGLYGNRDYFLYRTHILGSDTVPYNKDVNEYREEIRNDKIKFIEASFVELFTSKAKKIQIFFTDFFGIGKTYNVPGTKKDCWTLRLPDNFEKLYIENLKKGLAINIPKVIATAIRHKGEEFAKNNSKLLESLDEFAKILKS